MERLLKKRKEGVSSEIWKEGWSLLSTDRKTISVATAEEPGLVIFKKCEVAKR